MVPRNSRDGARYYDPSVGRFTGVDPIADQFAWVSTYNYAENEPISNIDLWGLQKFYAAGGKFLGKYGDSDAERIVHKPSNIRKVEKVLSEGDSYQKESFMTEFLSKDFSNRLLRSEDLSAEYDKFALRYKDNGEFEYAMAIYEGSFTGEDGNSFKGYVLGSVEKQDVKSKNGGASVVISDSKIPIYETGFWKIHSGIHTHPNGNVDNFSGIDNQDNGGPRFGFATTNDLGWSIQFNAEVLLAVPSSNQIATFSPSLYNQFMAETGANATIPSERNAQIKRAISLRTIGKK